VEGIGFAHREELCEKSPESAGDVHWHLY
jgi:hypothetical protein